MILPFGEDLQHGHPGPEETNFGSQSVAAMTLGLDDGRIDADLDKLRCTTLSAVDYITEPITYQQFFHQYLVPNRPCVFGPAFTCGWGSRRDWVTEDGKPNLEFLLKQFGQSVVPVANCNLEQYSSQPKRDMTLNDYISYWRKYSDDGGSPQSECLYLKDWHFKREFPSYNAYETPVFFQSDWMNEYWDVKQDDDYRFVYMGPKGTWTPFHADVLRSYSWSANVCGCKKWILFPPGEEEHLKDRFGQLAYDLRSEELKDKTKFPSAHKVQQRLEVIQRAGEMIFVPSGWHHQVFNMEDTISINHNWLNGCNVDISWNFVKSSLKDVQYEIQDCKDMDGWSQQCQLILNATVGIDYQDFYKFMYTIAKTRLNLLHQYFLKISRNQEKERQSEASRGSETMILAAMTTIMTLDEEKPNTLNRVHSEEVSETHHSQDASKGRHASLSYTGENIEGKFCGGLLDEKTVDSSSNQLDACDNETDSCIELDDGAEDCLDKISGDCHTEGRYSCSDGARGNDLSCGSRKPGDSFLNKERKDFEVGQEDAVLSRTLVNHYLFDLSRVLNILDDMVKNSEFEDLDVSDLPVSPANLIQDVRHLLEAH